MRRVENSMHTIALYVSYDETLYGAFSSHVSLRKKKNCFSYLAGTNKETRRRGGGGGA